MLKPRELESALRVGGYWNYTWAAGTGATDNAAGRAVEMKAVRILQAIGAKSRRTIRVALWDGKEASEEYPSSEDYVRRHFGDPVTMRLYHTAMRPGKMLRPPLPEAHR